MHPVKSIAIAACAALGCCAILSQPALGAKGPVPRKRAIKDSQRADSVSGEPKRTRPRSTRSRRLGSTRSPRSAQAPGRTRTSAIERSFLPRWKVLPQVTRRKPGFLFLLIDGSGSMAQPFARGVQKSASVAEVTNNVLGTLINRFKNGERVSDRLDVVALRYGDGSVTNALEGSLKATDGPLPISRFDAAKVDEVDKVDDNGNKFKLKAFVERGMPNGDTPMSKGFEEVLGAFQSWGAAQSPGERLVLGVHVSDGKFTDGDPTSKLAELQETARQQGSKLVMTNILLAKNGSQEKPILFPIPKEAEGFDKAGRLLFSLSSPVPEELARTLGTRPGARMMAYNADVEGLEKVFIAGSSSAVQ